MRPYEELCIAELVIYPPVLVANIFVLLRHGRSRQSGWVFLATFCLIRIIGACFGVAFGKTGDVNDFVWSVTLGSFGIGALLASTAALLQRVIDMTSTRRPRDPSEKTRFEIVVPSIPVVGMLYRVLYASPATATSRRSRLIQLTHLPSMIVLIIGIVGGTKLTSSKASVRKEGKTMIQASIIILVCVFVILVVLGAYTATEFGRVPSSEKRLLTAVLTAMPLIAIRILWSVLVNFTHLEKFNIVNGSVMVRGFMSTMEEFLVIIAYTIVGLMVQPQYQPSWDTEVAAQGKYEVHDEGKVAEHLPPHGFASRG